MRPSREREIISLRAEGHSLAAIGGRFGVSRQRVEQIIRQVGGAEVDRELSRARRQREVSARHALQTRLAAERAGEILERYRQGADPQLIARELGLQNKAVKALITQRRTDDDRAIRANARAVRSGPRYSNAQLADAVGLVARRVGRTPKCAEYEQLARELGLPSMATVYMRFGGWNKALQASGIEPRALAPVRAPKWHLAACWRALESVADQLGDPPRYSRYLKLAQSRQDLPSAATLRQRLGLWSEIAAALVVYRCDSEGSTRGEAVA